MIKIIKAGTSEGSFNQGSELAPDYLLENGLVKAFEQAELSYKILDDIRTNSHASKNDQNYLGQFNQAIYQLASQSVKKDDILLTLGGDHSVSIGSMFATKRLYPDARVVYIDAHPDCNDLAHTPTGNIHGMSLSTVMGDGLYDKFNLAKYDYGEVAIFAAKDIDDFEIKYLSDNQIKFITINQILHDGIGKSVDDLMTFAADYPLHISLDIDSIDQIFAPATGIKNQGGLNYREIKYVCQNLSGKNIRSIDLVELNPKLDEQNKTVDLAVEMIMSLLGKEWSNYQNYLKKHN